MRLKITIVDIAKKLNTTSATVSRALNDHPAISAKTKKRVLQAAEKLAELGINAEVINLRTIRPLDSYTILESVKKTNRVLSVEEGWLYAGIGSEIAAIVNEHAFDYLDAPVGRVGAKDVPLPYAANLEKLALPQVDDIVEAARKLCNK